MPVKDIGHRFAKIYVNRMGHLRISAISYLNTAPLMWDFEHGNAGKNFEISYTLPSQCARALREGSADIGIIPAAAYTTVPDLVILPGVAIAARQSVRSILLVSKVPIEKIRTIALDTSSMTSVALIKVLFAKWWGGRPEFHTMEPDLDEMLASRDAALVIGDPALKIDRSRYLTWDLAEEWFRLTSKPFVFAFWAVRHGALSQAGPSLDLAAIFQQSRDHGLAAASIDQIAREWSPRLSLSEDAIRSYLTDNIYYDLDPASMDGLRLFYRYAQACGALPVAPEIRFLYAVNAAIV
jgi:chorismate dehydratase